MGLFIVNLVAESNPGTGEDPILVPQATNSASLKDKQASKLRVWLIACAGVGLLAVFFSYLAKPSNTPRGAADAFLKEWSQGRSGSPYASTTMIAKVHDSTAIPERWEYRDEKIDPWFSKGEGSGTTAEVQYVIWASDAQGNHDNVYMGLTIVKMEGRWLVTDIKKRDSRYPW